MKKVLEVFGEPISRGGQESYVISALQNMDLSELQVDLFTPYYCDNQSYVDYMSSIGGKVIHCDIPFKVGGTRREIIPCFNIYLKKNMYDVVHIHSGSVSVLAYYARVASKNGVKKVIVHSHSSGIKENLKHFLMKTYAALIFKKYATDYCACSVEAAKWKFPKSVLHDVKILKNGVDLNKFKFDSDIRNMMRNKYGIKDNELILGHVGRFTFEKNQIFLIDVLKDYISNFGNAKLILVGDGTELNSVKSKVNSLELENNVIFTGSQENVNEYMDMFDVFLFPSLYEGLGIVGIEAQASGLPVIASIYIPKAINISKKVRFCNVNSVKQWSNEIDKLKNIGRSDNYQIIKLRGFDIKDSSRTVLNMYLY